MKIVLLILAAMVIYSPFYSKTPSVEPILMINNEMHTAPIYRIDVDRQERYLVTAAYDKTARLWDAKSGELIKIFRSPIDTGNEGRIYSCALSPDGRTLAVGGWTGNDWHDSNNIYIFNTSSGDAILKTKPTLQPQFFISSHVRSICSVASI